MTNYQGNVRTFLSNNCRNYDYDTCYDHLDICTPRRSSYSRSPRRASCAARSGFASRPLTLDEYQRLMKNELKEIHPDSLFTVTRELDPKGKSVRKERSFSFFSDNNNKNNNNINDQDQDQDYTNMRDSTLSNVYVINSNPNSIPLKSKQISLALSSPRISLPAFTTQSKPQELNFQNLPSDILKLILPRLTAPEMANLVRGGNREVRDKSKIYLEAIQKCSPISYHKLRCYDKKWQNESKCDKYCNSFDQSTYDDYFWQLINLSSNEDTHDKFLMELSLLSLPELLMIRMIYKYYLSQIERFMDMTVRVILGISNYKETHGVPFNIISKGKPLVKGIIDDINKLQLNNLRPDESRLIRSQAFPEIYYKNNLANTRNVKKLDWFEPYLNIELRKHGYFDKNGPNEYYNHEEPPLGDPFDLSR